MPPVTQTNTLKNKLCDFLIDYRLLSIYSEHTG